MCLQLSLKVLCLFIRRNALRRSRRWISHTFVAAAGVIILNAKILVTAVIVAEMRRSRTGNIAEIKSEMIFMRSRLLFVNANTGGFSLFVWVLRSVITN